MYLKQTGENKWNTIISHGKDSEGKRIKFNKTFKASSREEAKKIAEQYERCIKQGKPIIDLNKLKFKDYLEDFWEHKSSDIKERTREMYADIISNFLVKQFGEMKLREISTRDIDKYILSLAKDGIRRDGKSGGYSPKTRLHHFNLLNSIFEQAVSWEYIEKNPCTKAKRPKQVKVEKQILSKEEIGLMFKELENEKLIYKVFVRVAVFTGARRSEMVGLKWSDINFKENYLTIRRTVHVNEHKGVYVQEGTKNGDASRVVAIPQSVVDLLVEYRKSDESFKDESYLFHKIDDNLSPGRPDRYTKWVRKFQNKYDLKKVCIHELRHTSISLLMNEGANPYSVAKRHGHSVDVALNIYSHDTLEEQKSMVYNMESLLA